MASTKVNQVVIWQHKLHPCMIYIHVSMTHIHDKYPWHTSMTHIHDIHPWHTSMTHNHNIHTWQTSMTQIHDTHPWHTSMTYIHVSITYIKDCSSSAFHKWTDKQNIRSSFVVIRHHSSLFVIIRHHVSSFVIMCHHTSSFVTFRHHVSSFVIIRHHSSSFVIIIIIISSSSSIICSHIEISEHSNCRLVPYWREFLGVSGSRTWSDTPFANTQV